MRGGKEGGEVGSGAAKDSLRRANRCLALRELCRMLAVVVDNLVWKTRYIRRGFLIVVNLDWSHNLCSALRMLF